MIGSAFSCASLPAVTGTCLPSREQLVSSLSIAGWFGVRNDEQREIGLGVAGVGVGELGGRGDRAGRDRGRGTDLRIFGSMFAWRL